MSDLPLRHRLQLWAPALGLACQLGQGQPSEAQGTPTEAGVEERQADTAPQWPDPTCFEKHIRTFEVADSVAMPAPGGVLVIGSSSIVGWHKTIARDLAPLRVRGFGGSVMNDVLHYVERVVLPYRPRGNCAV